MTTDLEAQLADLATALDAPTGEGIAPAVLERLRSEPAPPLGASSRSPSRRRLAVVGAALAIAAAGTAAAVPAVADWLGVRGVELRRYEGPTTTASTTAPTTVPPATAGAALDLGANVASLAAAEAAAGFPAVVPVELGPPDAVWVDDRGAAPFISLVYEGGPLVTEFDATLSADAVLAKMATPDTTIEHLRIGDEPAMWIEGVHAVAVRARGGSQVFERLRLSDRVLLVQHGRLTVRIEVPPGMSREDAVRIATSLPR